MKKLAVFFGSRPFLFFLLFTLLAYFPVFLPFFHIKNDLVTQNLPTRFVISESIRSGYPAWWNPYINFGLPQYGDMNNGFWNPFLWLIARLPGYSIWTITLEEMFYILIGGWGIFLLCKEWGSRQASAFTAGISYMCCGYVLGHLQHFCWITGTGFFPYVLLYFTKTHKWPVLRNFIMGGFSVFFFVASTHPGFIIGALYFLLFLHIVIYVFRKDQFRNFYHPRFWSVNLIFLLIGLVFSMLVLVSNVDVLIHISRANKLQLPEALLTPTSLPSYLSLLFPLAVQKAGFFHTDISMRNVYIGLPLLVGLAYFCISAGRKFVWAVLAALLFFVLLSAGSWFKIFAWHYLPLTGFVRLNGEFSYFSLLIMILAGTAGLEKYLLQGKPDQQLFAILRRVRWFFIAATGLAVILMLITHQSVLFNWPAAGGDFKLRIKQYIEGTGFWDLFLIQAIIQTVSILLFEKAGRSPEKLIVISAFNLMLLCWMILPFTGLGMASKSNRQALINTFPAGIHTQEQKALNDTRFIDSSHVRDLILLGSYSKKIGYPKEESYPVELNSTESFFRDTALVRFILRQSFVFLSADSTLASATAFSPGDIHIISFGPGKLELNITNNRFHYLTLLQNDYPYWNVTVNRIPAAHFTGFKTFITVPLSPASRTVRFEFNPAPVRKLLMFELLIFSVALLLLCFPPTRNWPVYRISRN